MVIVDGSGKVVVCNGGGGGDVWLHVVLLWIEASGGEVVAL